VTSLYFPVLAAAEGHFVPAPRRGPSDHRHSTLLCIDNGREGAAELLGHIGTWLVEEDLIGSFHVWRKPTSSRSVQDVDLAVLGEGIDLVVAGVGSCGACTAGTVEDAIRFERSGIPSAVVITEVFRATADAVAEVLGATGFPQTAVEHPIGNRDSDWLRGAASFAAPQVFKSLTSAAEETSPFSSVARGKVRAEVASS
jgi:hypothetical protein